MLVKAQHDAAVLDLKQIIIIWMLGHKEKIGS